MRRTADENSVFINVILGANTPVKLGFDHEPTLEEVLETAGKTDGLATGQKVWVNGTQEAGMADTIEDGDSVQVVGKVEGGR